jgi:SAM-dependent methyltransferase
MEQVLRELPDVEAKLPVLLRRFEQHVSLPSRARVLELGAAQGMMVAALTRRGFDARGIEPWAEAVETSRTLADALGVEIRVEQAWAEDLPFEDAEFDLVLAESVMEHVRDPRAVFSEAFRVLRPGGAFHFYTTSALAPTQAEIKHFPLFPWYPAPVKRRIMRWATQKHPSLVGGTEMPAVHWYTPWGIRRDLERVGFARVIERWDLLLEDELDGWRRRALRIARRSRLMRLAGEIVMPGSGYLAIKSPI